MRLISTQDLTLHEFHGHRIPKYAILSHRWGENEVTFEEMRDRNKQQSRTMIIVRNGVREEVTICDQPSQMDENSQGWQKIKGCCSLAAEQGYEYVWIDTCCINKTSSAELTEAINSMFRWYEEAHVCFAYLSDVPSAEDDPRTLGSAFRRSVWFTRCWTLQELLAPDYLEFYSTDWELIGTTDTLNDVITELTGIPDPINEWDTACIAQKMSWASRRECERLEDEAYSLLGLFGIYMPPLYGEGQHAFHRLQLGIIRQSDDESIFAWTSPFGNQIRFHCMPILAMSPRYFDKSTDVEDHNFVARGHYSTTNRGLQIETILLNIPGLVHHKTRSSDGNRLVAIPLNCFSRRSRKVPTPLVLEPRGGPDRWSRVLQSDYTLDSDLWNTIWTDDHDRVLRGGDEASAVKKKSIYIVI